MTRACVEVRIGVDIGGTFTDIVLERGAERFTAKVLTTPDAPEEGVRQGLTQAMESCGVAPHEVALVIHGTTLATNAMIERKGARTALITTEGFRDAIEMGTESRFEQYDIDMEKPVPLVPRQWRFPIPERLNAAGDPILPLDEAAVAATAARLAAERIESAAVGLLHSYVNPAHERRVRDILQDALPDLGITLSSEVAPEMREYERFSTACANAYVQPVMARYLRNLEHGLREAGFRCPLFVMLSGGGVADIGTAIRFPIRLVESGPVGGAVFASHVARRCGLDRVLSFDMGGTTAKICLIDDAQPQTTRAFEVARAHRFLKGSGLPLRIPVIEMVEIGAGGGSIAAVDRLGRIAVGPESAGAQPGPACYGQGGAEPTVTDADLAMGRIDPAEFSGGRIALDAQAAADSLASAIGSPLDLEPQMAALGVSEMVGENMASAARVHAIEIGATLGERTMIAFGGAAPLHAARLAEKLDMDRILIPTAAAVGSAVGFLCAPVAYEVVRSAYQVLSAFNPEAANRVLGEMRDEAAAIVAQGAPGAPTQEHRSAYMRYLGQGHEVVVPLPNRTWEREDTAIISEAFATAYEALYGRIIPKLDLEIVSWSVGVSAVPEGVASVAPPAPAAAPQARGVRPVLDPGSGRVVDAALYRRADFAPGAQVDGPALIVETDTTAVVSAAFTASVDALGAIVMERRPPRGEDAR